MLSSLSLSSPQETGEEEESTGERLVFAQSRREELSPNEMVRSFVFVVRAGKLCFAEEEGAKI